MTVEVIAAAGEAALSATRNFELDVYYYAYGSVEYVRHSEFLGLAPGWAAVTSFGGGFTPRGGFPTAEAACEYARSGRRGAF